MERLPDSSLVIGVATSTAERVHLARLLGGADALLLVSSAEQARAFLELTSAGESTPVVLTPTVLPTASRGAVTAQIGSVVREAPAQLAAAVVPAAQLAAAVPVARLAAEESADEIPVASLRLDEDRRVVQWNDREVPLTRLEHDFLNCLVKEPGQVWTYQSLHHAVWGNEHLGHGSHIHSVVKRLRQKLASLGASVTIHAVRGVGFHLLPAA